MSIAPEGRIIVAAAAAAAALVTALFGWNLPALFAWAAVLFVAQFFREPARRIIASDQDIVSPADGKVVFVGPAPAPDGKESLKISVFMNVFNVHSNRSPAAGGVSESRRFPGAFFNAALDKSSERNERHMLAIDSAHGKIFCVQVAGLLARRVLCHARVGDSLKTGERYGFIRFGSRADLYLPLHLRPAVALGDKVLAGITVMAVP